MLSMLDTEVIREAARNISQTPIEGQIIFPELARANGLRCKEFDVETPDGYLLKLFKYPVIRHLCS